MPAVVLTVDMGKWRWVRLVRHAQKALCTRKFGLNLFKRGRLSAAPQYDR
jgi:hypothetical protein